MLLPEDTVMIGDSPLTSDIAGGQAFGMEGFVCSEKRMDAGYTGCTVGGSVGR